MDEMQLGRNSPKRLGSGLQEGEIWLSWPAALEARPRPCYRPAPTKSLRSFLRRGGRVVECVALEMRSTGNRTGGSNPSLSASF